MSEMQWIRSHVERLLQHELWQDCQVRVDDDGDYPFRSGTAMCWVTVLDTDPIMVRVLAHAAVGVRPTPKLYRELNDIQRRALSASVGYGHNIITVSQTISPLGLTGPVLAQALSAVGSVANDVGVLLAAMFGGRTPFPAEATTDESIT